VIILHIGGQGNGRKNMAGEVKITVPKRASIWSRPEEKKRR